MSRLECLGGRHCVQVFSTSVSTVDQLIHRGAGSYWSILCGTSRYIGVVLADPDLSIAPAFGRSPPQRSRVLGLPSDDLPNMRLDLEEIHLLLLLLKQKTSRLLRRHSQEDVDETEAYVERG